MIIDSTTIGMESARTYSSISKDAQLAGAVTIGMPTFAELLTADDSGNKADTLKNAGQTELSDIVGLMKTEGSKRLREIREDELRKKLSDATLKYLLKLMYGEDWEEKYKAAETHNIDTGGMGRSGTGVSAGLSSGGLSLMSCHYDYESETTVFSTTGTAITADGREISFNIEAAMSREFIEYSQVELMLDPMLTDPLVINLDSDIADISDQKFFFDIDADGAREEISELGPGSGYLALDRNGDGIVNDGSELFGSASGNGFSELAAYDSDGNGWIDEADDIFSKLRIWKSDENGNKRLIGLAELGIGALCLRNIGTEFSVKDDVNATKAVIRNSGMFLFEDGRAGTLQQLDMAMKKLT